MKVLAISPHPDDVEYGCGGLLKALSESDTVDVAVVCGEGQLLMRRTNEDVSFRSRMQEQAASSKILGISTTHFLEFAPASKFDGRPLSDLVRMFDKLFPKYNRILIPLPSNNQDHRIVWEACMASIRQGVCDRADIYAYEQPMQGSGPHTHASFPQKGYFGLTISFFESQLAAIQAHRSQLAGREGTLASLDAVRALARLRGMESGWDLATMLYPIRVNL